MRTLGLLGGMSAESSLEYYRKLNDGVREARGGLQSANLWLRSLNFADVAALQHREDWRSLDAWIVKEAECLKAAGAEGLLICSNLMHRCADAIRQAVDLELIHIAREVARAAKRKGASSLAVLGAKPTMEATFYREVLASEGISETFIPDAGGREFVQRLIYQELCCGIFREESRFQLERLLDELIEKGANGIVLGCTELPLLLTRREGKGAELAYRNVPLLDSMQIHCDAALAWMLGGTEKIVKKD